MFYSLANLVSRILWKFYDFFFPWQLKLGLWVIVWGRIWGKRWGGRGNVIIIILDNRTMSITLVLSLIVPLAFVLVVPIFLYYSLKSYTILRDFSTELSVCNPRLPNFSVCYQSDRRKSSYKPPRRKTPRVPTSSHLPNAPRMPKLSTKIP